MGQGQSGEHLAAGVISYVVQASKPELMAMRRHMGDSSKKKDQGQGMITRKQFHQAEAVV
eukprot:CAMPEP_0118987926 /NCGR_PEP_ID=MMETSP1173-20130426/45208_1 /TAXON_ID=1034831 /ORGANISM="Rhizochromulina marina cf, Strain CCMP1243" /LENGTH=59 /DNA_ID=CAMNT_0006938825 /DNA_START=13 /DNA_END=189 /DNA_ORIENTATION=+